MSEIETIRYELENNVLGFGVTNNKYVANQFIKYGYKVEFKYNTWYIYISAYYYRLNKILEKGNKQFWIGDK